MGRINLSRVVNSVVLAESYTIQRMTGVFQMGGWVQTPTNVPGYGVVSVASDEDLLMIPEADRVTGAMVFHSEQEIYITKLDNGFGQGTGGFGSGGFGSTQQNISDQIFWNGDLYRVMHVAPYPNRNYWRAIGLRMAGQ